MRIAIATEGNEVSPHFGNCSGYTLVDIENNKIVNQKLIDCPPHEPGFLPVYLAENEANVVVAGGMGNKAKMLFAQKGIQVMTGVSGIVDDVVKQFIEGTLKSIDVECAHDRADHDDEGHHCGH